MCRQTNAKAAASVLDIPVMAIYKNAEEEPDKQRLIRLQLRQRYIAAMTIGMSPVVFSRKLMELWGGSITARHVRVDKNGNFMKEEPQLPRPVVPAPGAPNAVPPVAASTTATTVVNKEAIPSGAADAPTGATSTDAPSLVQPMSSNVPTVMTTLPPCTTPAGINQTQLLVKEDAIMTDAVSVPSAQPVQEGSVPMEVEKLAQGTADVAMEGDDATIVKKGDLTDKDFKMEAQVETEKSRAVATISHVDPVPAAALQKEQPTVLEAASSSTQAQSVPDSVSATEDAQSKEIKAESILEPAAAPKGETSTTTEEVKDEPPSDVVTGTKMVVSEKSGKGDMPADGKPEDAVASVEAHDEIKVEGDAVTQQETGSTLVEGAKVEETMNVDETKTDESVKEEKQNVADETPAQITEELAAAAVAMESKNDVEQVPKMEEPKEELISKEQLEAKEEPAEEKPASSAVEEKEDEKEIEEKPAVKAEEVDDTKETTNAEATEEKKVDAVKEEAMEEQRPRSNSRTRRKQSDADANEKPLEEIESPRASTRRRKLMEEQPEMKSPDKVDEEDEEEDIGGSPRSPGKRNKRRKQR
jgi:hypothetical protein